MGNEYNQNKSDLKKSDMKPIVLSNDYTAIFFKIKINYLSTDSIRMLFITQRLSFGL